MQTFLPFKDPRLVATVLDKKRLGKQRVEAVQILNALLYPTAKKGWRNHPAVKMWKGYEPYLCKVYLVAMMDAWKRLGYSNKKCEERYQNFMTISQIRDCDPVVPDWITDELCETHRSRLVQKDAVFYRKFFPDTPDNLNYLWPR